MKRLIFLCVPALFSFTALNAAPTISWPFNDYKKEISKLRQRVENLEKAQKNNNLAIESLQKELDALKDQLITSTEEISGIDSTSVTISSKK